jgi:hypothetical protein
MTKGMQFHHLYIGTLRTNDIISYNFERLPLSYLRRMLSDR